MHDAALLFRVDAIRQCEGEHVIIAVIEEQPVRIVRLS
jgi:hypothetical protein